MLNNTDTNRGCIALSRSFWLILINNLTTLNVKKNKGKKVVPADGRSCEFWGAC